MTINVSIPGGGSVTFPEGTDAATIDSVMRQHFGGSTTGGGTARPSQLLSDAEVGLGPAAAPAAAGWDAFPLAAAPAAAGWDAFPLASTTPAPAPPGGNFFDQFDEPQKPSIDSPKYAEYLAKKHGVSTDYIEGIKHSQTQTSAVHGAPILGGLAQRAEPYIAAAAQPLTGAGAEGTSIASRADKNRALFAEIQSDFQREHPALDTASGLIGGALATAPLAATGVGAKMLGLGGRTLSGQIARGAISGAGINATDAAVRGGDVGTAGLIGGAIGVGSPVVARTVGALAAPVINTVRGIANPTGEALRRVATAADADIGAAARAGGPPAGLSPAEFSGARAAGAPVTNMDVGGETTRALARSAANTSPEGRAILNRAIDDRYQGQSQRLSDWLNSTFNYPNVEAQQAALAVEAKTVNKAAYGAAERHPAAQAMWGPQFEQIMQSPDVQEAARQAARTSANKATAQGFTPPRNPFEWDANGRFTMATDAKGNQVLPNLPFWDAVKQNLDDKIGAAMRAGEKGHAGDLLGLKNQLVGHLDQAVPSYAQARAGAASFFGADNALDAGRQFASPGRNFDNRAARAALDKMTGQQKQLFQDGFVDQYIQNIRKTPDRNNVLNRIANSDMAREQLHIALGPQRASELESFLRVERVMDQARGAVQGNSTTARQLTELGLAGAGGSVLSGGNPLADPGAMLNTLLIYGAMKGSRAGLNAIDHRVAGQVARLLTSNDPKQVRFGMTMLGRNQRLLGALRHADTALARTGAAQVTSGGSVEPARQAIP